jgi:hypothetical protein
MSMSVRGGGADDVVADTPLVAPPLMWMVNAAGVLSRKLPCGTSTLIPSLVALCLILVEAPLLACHVCILLLTVLQKSNKDKAAALSGTQTACRPSFRGHVPAHAARMCCSIQRRIPPTFDLVRASHDVFCVPAPYPVVFLRGRFDVVPVLLLGLAIVQFLLPVEALILSPVCAGCSARLD